MEDSENLTEDLNPWELARNMSLKEASNFNSVFAKAGSKERGIFQRASAVDGDPFVLAPENEIYLEKEKAAFHSTPSSIKVEQEDFAGDSFEQTSSINGHGKNITDFGRTTSSVFSKASSLGPVLKEGQSESGSVPDAKDISDELNCGPPKKLNTLHGEPKEGDSSSVDTPKSVVPLVKKVPVFGGRKTQIAKGELDEEKTVPKKIPKFSSTVIKKTPTFASSHSVLGSKGNITGRQLLRPSFQDNQINSDMEKSVLETFEKDKVETESLRKYKKHETLSKDKGKERLKEPQSGISSESLSATDGKENAKSLTFKTVSRSYKNKLEEMLKAKTPIKSDQKPNIKDSASSKTKVEGKCKATKFQLISKIGGKNSIKEPEMTGPLELACHDEKEFKSSSSLSEQKLGKTTDVCDDEPNNKLCDLENEETDISVDDSIELESNRMGEGNGNREIDLEVPIDSKIADFETDLISSDSQKQDLTKEMNPNKNAEEPENVLFNLNVKKDKKSELKMMKSSDLENGNSFVKKVDNKWDQFFSEVISQVMNKDENAEDRKEFQVKSRNVKKSHRFKGAVEKKNCWSNGTLRIDEDKENVTSVSMKRCKSKRKPLKQVNMNKRLRSKKEAVASDQKLLSRSSSDSEASEHDDSPRTLAYKRELLHIVEKTYDSWVQCDTCSKWRKLPPNIDPASLPPKWFCELNYNENQNVCSAPEDDWNKEYVYVYNGYILGSVVWARVTGRDWWPAMVDIDPDFQIHNWLDDSAKNVEYYHVTFFEEPVSRGWVLSKDVMKFRTTDTHERFLAVSSKDSSNKFSLKKAVQLAHDAMNMSLAERKKKYTFHSRYRGTIGRRGKSISSTTFEQNTLGNQEKSSLTTTKNNSEIAVIESKNGAPSTCESPHADKAPFLEQGIPHDRQTANGIAGTNKKEEGKYVQPQSDSDVDGEERRALGKNCTIHIKEKYSCNAEYVPSQKYFVENTKDSQPEDSNKECRKTAEFFDSKQSQIDLCDDEKESEFKSCMTNMSPEVPSSEEMHDTINTIIRNLDMITSQDESLPSNGGKFLNNKNK